jgi:membrane-associated phospholipid phosphatase
VALLLAGAAVGHASSRTQRGRSLDGDVFKTVNAGHGRMPDAVFGAVTELGSLYASAAAAGVLAVAGRRRAARSAALAAGTAWLLGQGLKRATARPRPYEDDPGGARRMIARPQGASWPSNHPMVLTAFTTVAARELGLGRAARASLLGLNATVAASRVYLGVHYPSDVVSGLFFGRALGLLWPGGQACALSSASARRLPRRP